MSLRDATIRLAKANPSLRKALLEVLGARYPSKGDEVLLSNRVKGSEGGVYYPVLDVRERFTEWGPKPYAPQVLVNVNGEDRWIWAWNAGFGTYPKNLREHIDTAMKVVLRALGPLKKNMKRTTGRTRGTRTLEPKRPMSYDDAIKLLERSSDLKGGSKWDNKRSFTTKVQTGEGKFKDFTVTAFQSYDGTNLGKILIDG